jgi:hypothetical protein
VVERVGVVEVVEVVERLLIDSVYLYTPHGYKL